MEKGSKNHLEAYFSYGDITHIKTKSRHATKAGVCVETYRIGRMRAGTAAREYKVITKMDVNAHGQLVEVRLELPQYTENGETVPQELDTFSGRYSWQALLKMRDDFLACQVGSDEFRRKYGLRHAGDALRILGKKGLLDTLSRKHVSCRNLWLIRYEYRGKTMTFCVDCDGYESRTYSLIDIITSQDIPSAAREVRALFAEPPERICLNFSCGFADSISSEFPGTEVICDHYQDALAMEEGCRLSNERAVKARLQKYAQFILHDSGLQRNEPLSYHHALALENILVEVSCFLTGHGRDPGAKYVRRYLKERALAYSPMDEKQLYSPCFREPVPYRIMEMMRRIMNTRSGTRNYSPERMRLILLYKMAELNAQAVMNSASMGGRNHVATPLTMELVTISMHADTRFDLRPPMAMDDILFLCRYYEWLDGTRNNSERKS